MNKFIICIFSLITLVSCSMSDTENTCKALRGTWILDRITDETGEWHKKTFLIEEFSFKGMSNCFSEIKYDWKSADMIYELVYNYNHQMRSFTGKYFILENPNRGRKTLTIVPDLVCNQKDTIRKPCLNYDIVYLDDNRLVLIGETEFIPGVKPTFTPSTETRVYKKIR